MRRSQCVRRERLLGDGEVVSFEGRAGVIGAMVVGGEGEVVGVLVALHHVVCSVMSSGH